MKGIQSQPNTHVASNSINQYNTVFKVIVENAETPLAKEVPAELSPGRGFIKN